MIKILAKCFQRHARVCLNFAVDHKDLWQCHWIQQGLVHPRMLQFHHIYGYMHHDCIMSPWSFLVQGGNFCRQGDTFLLCFFWSPSPMGRWRKPLKGEKTAEPQSHSTTKADRPEPSSSSTPSSSSFWRGRTEMSKKLTRIVDDDGTLNTCFGEGWETVSLEFHEVFFSPELVADLVIGLSHHEVQFVEYMTSIGFYVWWPIIDI